LQGTLTQVGVGAIRKGTYNKFEFKVKKLDEDDLKDPNDPQFADFKGTKKSMIMEGTYSGKSFNLSMERDFEQETEFMVPLEIVSDTSKTNLTLMVNVTNWFFGIDTTKALNDAVNIEKIAKNIEASFETFEDKDGDKELDFKGKVLGVDVSNKSFTLDLDKDLVVKTDNSTKFEGSIVSLDAVKSLLDQGKKVKAEGEGKRQSDGSVLASKVKFEED
jgi:hypothetical protein